jgi:hypothetical protein
MIRKFVAAIFGAVVFGILSPLGYFLAFDGFPIEGITGVAGLAGVGALVGAILGWLFPRFFTFVFEVFLEL